MFRGSSRAIRASGGLPGFLQGDAVQAAERAKKRVSAALKCNEDAVSVDCASQGPEKEKAERNRRCLMKEEYVWSTSWGTLVHLGPGSEGAGTNEMCVCPFQCVFVPLRALGQALHAGGFRSIPWEFKMPLLATPMERPAQDL